MERVDDDEISPKEWSKNHLQCSKIACNGSVVCTPLEDIK